MAEAINKQSKQLHFFIKCSMDDTFLHAPVLIYC